MKWGLPVTGPAVYGLVLSTVSEPHETIPFNPVSDRSGAESVPSTEAPLVTDCGRAGASELSARMLFTTAAAAVAMLKERLNAITEAAVGPMITIRAVSCLITRV